MRSLKKSATGVAVVSALCLTAACGASGGSSGGSASGGNDSSEKGSSSNSSMTKASSDLVGPGCASYAKMEPKGAGSVQGMAEDPVATAASNNPLLKTLVAAVSGKLNPKVNLVNTLNNGKFTVFAPVDDAFAKLPKKTVAALQEPKNAQMLTKILTYHVVPGQLSPSQIEGTHKTAEGDSVKVTGSGDHLVVDDAKVICGGVHTANATVYLIDSVLSPKM